MPPTATLTAIDWAATKAALEAALSSKPAAYTAAASRILGGLTSKGADYDAAVPGRIVTLSAWQAELAANRTAWDAAILPLYQAAIDAWQAHGSYVHPGNPDGTDLPLSLDELPATQAGLTLLDSNPLPSVLLKAREPGLWGNQVSVRSLTTTLEVKFGGGATVFSVPVPSVGDPWAFTNPFGQPWPDGYGIGALIEQPTWAPGATLPPAGLSFTALTGGAGLVLSRLLGQLIPFSLPPGERSGMASRALAAEFYRVSVKLVNDAGVLRPVPAGLPGGYRALGSVGETWYRDNELRYYRDNAQRFMDAL